MGHVLVVDDEPSICWAFRELLVEEGHTVSVAASAEEALQLVRQIVPDAVVLDVRLPGLDGISAIERLRVRIGGAPIIVMTAFGDLEVAVRAVEAGAFDYLTKPFDLDRAAFLLQQALKRSPTAKLPGPAAGASQEVPNDAIIGNSPAMQAVFKQIALVSGHDVPVLIAGESGTGKELVARAVHRHSARRHGPFLPVCLPALSPSVVESELFGHVKGAFTGAERDRAGILELADGGTVFLDEVADASLAVQVKLLRALEQREVTPVGDARPRRSNFRIVAATNRPLAERVAAREFREDLFFRLSVFQIELPPLRERREDIPLLAQFFLSRLRDLPFPCSFSGAGIDELVRRPWSGNVRELRNAVERAAIVARGVEIGPEHFPASAASPRAAGDRGACESELQHQTAAWLAEQLRGGESPTALYERFLAIVEPPLFEASLEGCGQNRAATARMLGIHRETLRDKLKRHGIGP